MIAGTRARVPARRRMRMGCRLMVNFGLLSAKEDRGIDAPVEGNFSVIGIAREGHRAIPRSTRPQCLKTTRAANLPPESMRVVCRQLEGTEIFITAIVRIKTQRRVLSGVKLCNPQAKIYDRLAATSKYAQTEIFAGLKVQDFTTLRISSMLRRQNLASVRVRYFVLAPTWKRVSGFDW